MKRTPLFLILSFALLTFCVGGESHAGVMTFDGEVGFAAPPATIVSDGFTFTPTDVSGSFITLQNQSDIVGNGTTNLFAANHTLLTMSRPAPFSVKSFDIGGSFKDSPNRWADGVVIAGLINGGGSVTFTIDIPDVDPVLKSVVLPAEFDNLTSLIFRPFAKQGGNVNDYEFVLDNIEYGAAGVPEPGTLATALVGLGLVGWARWRRKS